MNKRGRPRGVTASPDTLAMVYLLKKKLKWSYRRIGRLFHHDHTVIYDWYVIALKEIGDNYPTILYKGEKRSIEIIPVGNSKDVEYLHGLIHQNPCKGGRQVKPNRYGDEWEDEKNVNLKKR